MNENKNDMNEWARPALIEVALFAAQQPLPICMTVVGAPGCEEGDVAIITIRGKEVVSFVRRWLSENTGMPSKNTESCRDIKPDGGADL